ncbi:uroporphyrinogen-III C-methyltransferase [Marinobacter sp. BSs20148]|jgi:uroporphyrin-3 C-methyltransferase|uniref:uroporphyrinogen-III C-methyltransferase n=1 Tax=Marinobacter TaxID=2742 RepID=UPI0005A27493|nr:uroporphyrinogen-III C-methyltransferase [Marinobacter sp. BSs20148]
MPVTNTQKQLPAPIAQQQQPERPHTWPLWLISIIALVLVLLLVLWNWQQWNNNQASQQALKDLQQETAQLDSRYGERGSQQAQRLQSLTDAMAAQRELIATQQRQIDHNATTLLEAGNRTRTDWLLAEAEYLLRVANQRLLMEKDIKGAASALQAADDVLAESDDIGVYPVRQQLAREMLALKSIVAVDRTGLYLQLEAVIDSIHQLTNQALIYENAPGFMLSADASDVDAGKPSVAARAWQSFTRTLKQVVVVRRLDEQVKPLLSPDQSAYARLNLQLMLEEAELAVLRGNQALYQKSLEKARATVQEWYNADNARVGAMADTLGELASHNVDPELPDISRSLGLLKQRVSGRGVNNNGDQDAPANSDDQDGDAPVNGAAGNGGNT